MLLTAERLAQDYPRAKLITGATSDRIFWRTYPFKPHLIVAGVGPVRKDIPVQCRLEVHSRLPEGLYVHREFEIQYSDYFIYACPPRPRTRWYVRPHVRVYTGKGRRLKWTVAIAGWHANTPVGDPREIRQVYVFGNGWEP